MNAAADAARGLDVLLFYDCIYPHSLGGVEHRNLELAKALARRGHRVTLAGFSPEASQPAPGVRVLPVAPPGRLYTASGRRSTGESLRLAAAAAHLDLEPYDVIETANIPYAHLPLLALRCRRQRKPLLISWYEYWGKYWREYQGPIKWLPYALVEWLTVHLGTEVNACSRLTGERVHARRGRGKVEIIPVGIDIDRIRGAAARGRQSGPPLIYAGRLVAEKQIDLLLRAVQRLAATREGPILTLVGDGPERQALTELTAELSLDDRVEITGRLAENEDVWERFGSAQIAVQPSSREGFGMFPLEAMASGLPVVYCTSAESALSELVEDGRQGIATPPDADALAAALDRLLKDDDERQRLADHARKRAEAYAWEQVAEQFEGVLRSCLELKRR